MNISEGQQLQHATQTSSAFKQTTVINVNGNSNAFKKTNYIILPLSVGLNLIHLSKTQFLILMLFTHDTCVGRSRGYVTCEKIDLQLSSKNVNIVTLSWSIETNNHRLVWREGFFLPEPWTGSKIAKYLLPWWGKHS